MSGSSHPRDTGLPSYVLVTPARNEARVIEGTIRAVIAQTVLPLKWAIVSDGSNDGTDEIVQRYAAQHPWIELVRTPERKERHFAGKVMAFNAGLARMEGIAYEVIASLDADITFEADYFEFLLEKLAFDPDLGIVGTPYRDTTSEVYDFRFVSTDHVSGACQVFRRACFEEIGGYIPVKGGAIDSIATLSARMKGWKTRTFPEKICLHHKALGSAQAGPVKARFDLGKRDYAVGNHPLWEMCRGLYQMCKPPYVVRGLAVMAGFAWAATHSADRPIPRELLAFRRKEQMQRLGSLITGKKQDESSVSRRHAAS